MPCEIAALATAVIVVRGPFDEFFRLLMLRAARCNSVGAEASGLASAQTLQANRRRDVQKYHQIKKRNDGVAPAIERSTQHPIRSIQEHLAHQPETIGNLADFLIRRCCGPPKII